MVDNGDSTVCELRYDLWHNLVQMKAFILIDPIELKAFIVAMLNE